MTRNNEIGLKDYFNEKFEALNKNFDRLEKLMTETVEILNDVQTKGNQREARISTLESMLRPKHPEQGYVSRFEELEHGFDKMLNKAKFQSLKWIAIALVVFTAMYIEQSREVIAIVIPHIFGL